jgi:hypothetical protein
MIPGRGLTSLSAVRVFGDAKVKRWCTLLFCSTQLSSQLEQSFKTKKGWVSLDPFALNSKRKRELPSGTFDSPANEKVKTLRVVFFVFPGFQVALCKSSKAKKDQASA